MKKLLIALAAVALLGGCFKVDRSLPKDLPSYVSIYPGAQPVVSIDMGAMMSVGLQTSASPDDVIAYYRAQAAANGLQEQTGPATASASADQRQVMFHDAAGHTLVVGAKPQNGGTTISIVYTKPKAAGS